MIPSQPISPPVSPQRAKRLSVRSSSSSREIVEYEIWRRWEDCLEFQRTLEVEYHAISKRRRKGEPALNHHAKNMLYPSQRAASFESLPLGPDPSTIPVDVHAHIPKLSKKSTLFRMTESVNQQRGEEFKAMIEALFDEDAPSTLQELCTTSTVRDFFAYWKQDKDANRKMNKTPAVSSAIPLPSHQGKGGGPPKKSTVLTPELIAFATGGSTAGPSKLKHHTTGRSPQTTSNNSREAQRNPPYEFGRPTAPPFAQRTPPHVPNSAYEAVTNGEPQRRRSPPSRPVEGTTRADFLRSPALVNTQSKMPILDSPRPSSPYLDPPISPFNGEFDRPRQFSSPHTPSASSHSSFLSQRSTPVDSVFTSSAPFAHPMQTRTASMPGQRRHRDGQLSPSTGTSDRFLPVPTPRRRHGAVDASGNRSARYFDASTHVVNGPPPPKSSKLSVEQDVDTVDTGHLHGLLQWSSQSQAEMTASEHPFASITFSQTESRQSCDGSDTSAPSAVHTLLSTGYSTSVTTLQSSQHSPAQRHRIPSWSSRRMSLESLAPVDLEPYSKDSSRLYAPQDPNPRHSLSSDSSNTDGGLSDIALVRAPSVSMPSLISPMKTRLSARLPPPSPPPPRPPRSALRLSGTFSSGKRTSVVSSPPGSLLTFAEDRAVMPVDAWSPKRVSTNDDFVDSYFEMPSSAKLEDPFELEFRPQPPPAPVHRARGRANSSGTRQSNTPIIVPPLPSLQPPDSIAPSSTSHVRPVSPASPLMGQTTTIKAIHEASSTILLFRIPHMSTSLADLRAKLSRKFMEAENIHLYPEQFELRYLAPACVGPNVNSRPPPARCTGFKGRKRSASVNSTHGADGFWAPINTEADWYMVATTCSGKITVKVF